MKHTSTLVSSLARDAAALTHGETINLLQHKPLEIAKTATLKMASLPDGNANKPKINKHGHKGGKPPEYVANHSHWPTHIDDCHMAHQLSTA